MSAAMSLTDAAAMAGHSSAAPRQIKSHRLVHFAYHWTLPPFVRPWMRSGLDLNQITPQQQRQPKRQAAAPLALAARTAGQSFGRQELPRQQKCGTARWLSGFSANCRSMRTAKKSRLPSGKQCPAPAGRFRLFIRDRSSNASSQDRLIAALICRKNGRPIFRAPYS
jgi:hypothetical protein